MWFVPTGTPRNPSPLLGAAACKAPVKRGMKPCAELASMAAGGVTRRDGGVFPPGVEAYQGKTDSDWQVSSRQEGNGMSSHHYSRAGS